MFGLLNRQYLPRATRMWPQIVSRSISKELVQDWLGQKKELDLEVVKSIWPEKPKEVIVPADEHERRVIIAKNWSRYQRLQSLKKRKSESLANEALAKAELALNSVSPKLLASLKALPTPTTPSEIVPPYHTPPIPGFFHGKREV